MSDKKLIGFLVGGISLSPDESSKKACSVAVKEAKKAYHNENKMKKVEGGLEGLLSLIGGMDGI